MVVDASGVVVMVMDMQGGWCREGLFQLYMYASPLILAEK